MGDNSWYKKQIQEGAKQEVENLLEDTNDVFYKKSEGVPVEQEDLDKAYEAAKRCNDRLDYYQRAEDALDD